jgi:trigger factor
MARKKAKSKARNKAYSKNRNRTPSPATGGRGGSVKPDVGRPKPQTQRAANKRRTFIVAFISVLLGVALGITLYYTTFRDVPEENSEDTAGLENVSDPDILALLKKFPTNIPDEFNDISQRVPHFPSDGLDENGRWAGVRALDYVDFGTKDFTALEFPHFVHTVTDLQVADRMHSFVVSERFPFELVQVLDRAVEDGDTVNIDYFGTIDGVPFTGGSSFTEQEGTDELLAMGVNVLAGSDQFVDDFLTQIIGHMPGTTMNVYVTFPENYSERFPDTEGFFDGKDAMFEVTINFILEEETMDAYVKRHFYESWGWQTYDEYLEGLREIMRRDGIENYINTHIFEEPVEITVPARLRETAVDNVLRMHQNAAEIGGFATLGEYMERTPTIEVSTNSLRDLVRHSIPQVDLQLQGLLALQALAELWDIQATQDDVRDYLRAHGNSDFDKAVEEAGMPYWKQEATGWLVRNRITEHATLLDPPTL